MHFSFSMVYSCIDSYYSCSSSQMSVTGNDGTTLIEVRGNIFSPVSVLRLQYMFSIQIMESTYLDRWR